MNNKILNKYSLPKNYYYINYILEKYILETYKEYDTIIPNLIIFYCSNIKCKIGHGNDYREPKNKYNKKILQLIHNNDKIIKHINNDYEDNDNISILLNYDIID